MYDVLAFILTWVLLSVITGPVIGRLMSVGTEDREDDNEY